MGAVVEDHCLHRVVLRELEHRSDVHHTIRGPPQHKGRGAVGGRGGQGDVALHVRQVDQPEGRTLGKQLLVPAGIAHRQGEKEAGDGGGSVELEKGRSQGGVVRVSSARQMKLRGPGR